MHQLSTMENRSRWNTGQMMSNRSRWDTVETLALLGAAVLITMPAVRGIARRWRVKHPIAKTEPLIDKSLKDTYPASDPPASRYFDIPVNRR